MKLPFSVAILAAVITFAVFIPALGCGFVNWDDPDFIARFIGTPLDFDFIRGCFTSVSRDLWIPLTWLSLAVDYSIWGQDPFGFHLANVVIHSLNTGLVVICAYRIIALKSVDRPCQQPSATGLAFALLISGLLFGIHPLRVESVAWIAERKDVLNAFFAISSVLCYLEYITHARGGRGGYANRWYGAAIMLFSLSLLAKSVTVILPLIYVAIDWYFLGRFQKELHWRLLREKLPFLALSLIVALVTITAGQRNGILAGVQSLPAGSRIIISGNAIFEYIRLFFYPFDLSPLFPLPNQLTSAYYLKTAAIAFITVLFVKLHKKFPWATVTWACFVIPLLPVLAILQNGFQAYASRYSYLPSIAPAILVAVGILAVGNQPGAEMLPRIRNLIILTVLCGLLFIYGKETRQYIAVWQNTGTLWSRVITYAPLGRAYWHRGKYYLSEGDYQAAADDISRAISIAKDSGIKDLSFLYNARGSALAEMGRDK